MTNEVNQSVQNNQNLWTEFRKNRGVYICAPFKLTLLPYLHFFFVLALLFICVYFSHALLLHLHSFCTCAPFLLFLLFYFLHVESFGFCFPNKPVDFVCHHLLKDIGIVTITQLMMCSNLLQVNELSFERNGASLKLKNIRIYLPVHQDIVIAYGHVYQMCGRVKATTLTQ